MRIFMTGRADTCGVVDRELGGRATGLSIKPRDYDMVTYLRARLRKDTTPEVMDSALEKDVLKIIPKEIPESYVAAGNLRSLVSHILTDPNLDCYWLHSRSRQS